MGIARHVARFTGHILLGTAALFVQKMKSKEAHVMLDELKKIDTKVKEKIIDMHGAKKDFVRLFHKLENTLSRLKEEGEHFEARHLYHIYHRYAQAFEDEELLKKLKKLHP